MPHQRLESILAGRLRELDEQGTRKGRETVIDRVIEPSFTWGPRYVLLDDPNRPYIRMNSNGYLGLALDRRVREAEDRAVKRYGTGPGAVRFISGTWSPHKELEARLAAFHQRDAAMIYSSAYATVMGVLPPLVTDQTVVISDELNHNCIINATRLAQPKQKRIYRHLDMAELDRQLAEAAGDCVRAIIVTDGIFSMRGDHAPLDQICAIAEKHDSAFPENVIVIVDDSHGVGAFGETGRGTEEYVKATGVDLLVATLGKAFGVNGGYVVGARPFIDYLRETSPFYVYSNPITPAEAAAAKTAIDIVDSPSGQKLLDHLRAMTRRFEKGLADLGFETIPGEHPVVPLMVRDTAKTAALIAHLRAGGVLATGLNYPVVPKGDEEIRFQISADHTPGDIDEVLGILASFEA